MDNREQQVGRLNGMEQLRCNENWYVSFTECLV